MQSIAQIPEYEWEKGADRIALLIEELEARYESSLHSYQHITDTLVFDSSKVQRSLRTNRLSLPPTLDAIYGHLELEIRRLQGINDWSSRDAQQDARDLIRRLIAMANAVAELKAQAEALPMTPTQEDAEKTKALWQVYYDHGSAWPRDNAPEIVDLAWRGGLIGLTTAGLTLCGASPSAAVSVASILFGAKKVGEAVKSLKDAGAENAGG